MSVINFSFMSLFIILLPILINGLLFQDTQAQTLKEALVNAYLNNPKLNAGRIKQKSLDEDIAIANAGWRPTVVLGAGAGFSDTKSTSKLSDNAPNIERSDSIQPYSYSVSILEPLYKGGSTIAESRSALAKIKAGRADLLSLESKTLLEAVRAYVNVLSSEASLELSERNVTFVSRQFQAAKDKFAVGIITQTNVAQAKARFFQAKADKVSREGELITARSDYHRVVGLIPENLQWPKLAKRLPVNENEALEVALKLNHQIISAKYLEESATEQIKVAKASLLPEISLEANYTSQYELSSLTEENKVASITANINIPIYQSGAEYSGIRRNKLLAAERRLDIERVRRDVINDVTKAWENLTTSAASKTAFEVKVKAAQIALEGIEKEGYAGLRTTLDILDAEQDFYNSQLQLVKARAALISASYWVQATQGKLTANNLDLPVKLYNPISNYINVKSKWF